MKKTFKLLALVLSLVMMVASFAACGADTPDPTNSDETTTDSVEVTTELLELLDTENKVLKVGTNPEFPPFEFIGDNGEIDGFDIALIKAIADKIGLTVNVENMDFEALISAIGSRIDIVIAGMTITDERLLEVDFSDSYFTAVQYVIVAEGNDDIKTKADLNGKKIGVQDGTTGDFIASGETDPIEIEDAVVSRYSSAVLAVMDLVNGKLDAVIIDKNPALEFVNTYDGIKTIGEDFFAPEEYAIAIPKGNTALLNAINAGLVAVKADGTFDDLLEKYIVGENDAE